MVDVSNDIDRIIICSRVMKVVDSKLALPLGRTFSSKIARFIQSGGFELSCITDPVSFLVTWQLSFSLNKVAPLAPPDWRSSKLGRGARSPV